MHPWYTQDQVTTFYLLFQSGEAEAEEEDAMDGRGREERAEEGGEESSVDREFAGFHHWLAANLPSVPTRTCVRARRDPTWQWPVDTDYNSAPATN